MGGIRDLNLTPGNQYPTNLPCLAVSIPAEKNLRDIPGNRLGTERQASYLDCERVNTAVSGVRVRARLCQKHPATNRRCYSITGNIRAQGCDLVLSNISYYNYTFVYYYQNQVVLEVLRITRILCYVDSS